MTTETTIVISESRGVAPASQSLEKELLAELAHWHGIEVKVLPFLYDLEKDGKGMDHLRSVDRDMIVLAPLYPRAVFWLLNVNGIEGRPGGSGTVSDEPEQKTLTDEAGSDFRRTIWCFDTRRHASAEPLLGEIESAVLEGTGRQLRAARSGRQTPLSKALRIQETTQPRWYPVVDRGRCKNCLECLNFCLFGVFEVDAEGALLLEQPDACRNGCPACARVCPSQAIMFPMHNDPAIAGDPKAAPAAISAGLIQLLGGAKPQELAAAERGSALAKRAEANEVVSPAEEDDLDALVDDVDQMDL